MARAKTEDVRRDGEGAYTVVTADAGGVERPGRSGMAHGEAMMLAERLRHHAAVVRVMHVIGDKSYEVDRYPLR